MASTSDIKNGLVIRYKDDLVKIVEFQHVKTARGGAKIRTKMKNIRSGQVIDNTFRSGEKLDVVRLEAKKMQYLYNDGMNYVFMDNETYEQVVVSDLIFESYAPFVKENDVVKVLFEVDNPIDIEIPTHVELKIAKTEPGVKGDTVSGGSKPAEMETGLKVNVPLFLNEGELIKIDTRDGSYCERVK